MNYSAQSNPVAVVIPIYKPEFTPLEQVSLTQCNRILGRYPRIFIKPQALDAAPLVKRWNLTAAESFPDEFFYSVRDYSRLMLSEEFYDRFGAFGHILIHQLDAFVFRDDLADWCGRGYDYVGAPWLHRSCFSGAMRRVRNRALSALAAWTNSLIETDELLLSYINRVGNGGFSLRNPARFRAILRAQPRALKRYLYPDSKHYNEDVFWSLEVNRYVSRLRIPYWHEALSFAWESNPSKTFEQGGGRLPFGCHGWDKLVPEFWHPIIRAQGYEF